MSAPNRATLLPPPWYRLPNTHGTVTPSSTPPAGSRGSPVSQDPPNQAATKELIKAITDRRWWERDCTLPVLGQERCPPSRGPGPGPSLLGHTPPRNSSPPQPAKARRSHTDSEPEAPGAIARAAPSSDSGPGASAERRGVRTSPAPAAPGPALRAARTGDDSGADADNERDDTARPQGAPAIRAHRRPARPGRRRGSSAGARADAEHYARRAGWR